jgi:hypothetical protein
VPVGVGEIDRVDQEGRFIERNVEFKPHVKCEACFGEKQIPTACAAANGKIASADANSRKCIGNCSGGNRLLVREESWCRAIGRVDHVATKERYDVGWPIGLNQRHCTPDSSKRGNVAESAPFVEGPARFG